MRVVGGDEGDSSSVLQGPGQTAKVLDLQNGTNGRCRDDQRVLDELMETLDGYKEALGYEPLADMSRTRRTSR